MHSVHFSVVIRKAIKTIAQLIAPAPCEIGSKDNTKKTCKERKNELFRIKSKFLTSVAAKSAPWKEDTLAILRETDLLIKLHNNHKVIL